MPASDSPTNTHAYLVILGDPKNGPYVDEGQSSIGLSRSEFVNLLRGGTYYDLIRVLSLDVELLSRPTQDVTASLLAEIADHYRDRNEDVPESLRAACVQYGVAIHIPTEERFRDENDEHRQTAFDVLGPRRAA